MNLLTPHFGLFIWTLLAFVILLLILKKFAWKPILSMLNERETNIAESIASAEKVKAEMAQIKADNEKMMIQAREESGRLLKEAKDIKDKMIADAKAQAQAEASKIIEDARVQIENKKNTVMNELKNEVGTLAVGVAEKILRKQLDNNAAQADYVKLLSDEIKLN